MKESTKKMTRGQMVYAPITTGERSGKSPFGKNNNLLLINQHEQENEDKKRQESGEKVKMIVSNKRQEEEKIEKERLPSSPPKPGRISSQSKNEVYQQPSIDTLSSPTNNQLSFTLGSPPGASLSTPYHDYTLQLEALLKENEILRSREEIYVSKLLKLQEGLHRQHQEFMNLQELYTELFNVYKQKEEEFAELEMKYKATERSFGNGGYGSFRQDLTLSQREEQSAQKQPFNQQLQPSNTASLNSTTNFALYEEAFKQELSQLIYQNKRLNETNEKLITELNYVKSKHNLQSSKQFLETKVISEFNDTQKLLQQEKENKLQLEYQNKYLQLRNEDLEKTIVELENVITLKQSEIIKIREEKINIRKHSSEKVLNKSPPKSDSARSKSSNTEKKYSKLIDNLQKENHKLREENLNLKEKLRSNIIAISTQQKEQSIISNSRLLTDSHYTNSTMAKKLNFGDNESSENKSYLQNALSSYQNENFNSQNINEQYFSFSRERDDKLSEEELPTFPMDLEIEGIIRKHEENTFKQAEIYQQENSVEEEERESCEV